MKTFHVQMLQMIQSDRNSVHKKADAHALTGEQPMKAVRSPGDPSLDSTTRISLQSLCRTTSALHLARIFATTRKILHQSRCSLHTMQPFLGPPRSPPPPRCWLTSLHYLAQLFAS